jgi:hypothetical protein
LKKGNWGNELRGKLEEERRKRKEERGKKKEERRKRKEERGKIILIFEIEIEIDF